MDLTKIDMSDLILYAIALFASIKGIYSAGIWILDKLNIYHKAKSKEEELIDTLKRHSDQIINISDQINKIVKKMEENDMVQRIQCRHSITRACEEYLSRNPAVIEARELESLENMYDIYTNILKGNSYVHILVGNVRKMQITDKYREEMKDTK